MSGKSGQANTAPAFRGTEVPPKTGANRLRRALSIPASLMGGETTILNLSDVRDVLAENERLRAAIRWANGEGDSDFGDNVPDGAGMYWWRAELMRRAGL